MQLNSSSRAPHGGSRFQVQNHNQNYSMNRYSYNNGQSNRPQNSYEIYRPRNPNYQNYRLQNGNIQTCQHCNKRGQTLNVCSSRIVLCHSCTKQGHYVKDCNYKTPNYDQINDKVDNKNKVQLEPKNLN